ncbi:uncharacterized protein Z518_04381 [Rhinocladiella mackenziei CBS 650.93]|uniref:Uncharacterized protein n=1 Tax=Rhinocladiella mackenziei CBS 650.93 TaxID=1442369 RepID=A0A0D2JBB8_9EURO|nr:uncharacterized protein Z518_04381 [Rhinocladiella mackenziei CBS 650.93]KIX06405.1 hypothetical protein Z518_04381 [Rhinocladiella mackenziei CBS 650.93]
MVKTGSPSKMTKTKNIPSRGGVGWLIAGIFLLLSLLATYLLRVMPITSGVSEKMEYIAKTARFPEQGIPLRTTYTRIPPLDKGLSFLVAAFLHGAAGWDRGFYVLQVYFLISFFPVIAIWTVESCRRRNSLALISFTSIWAIFYQTVGGAIIVPLYYLAYLRDSSGSQYWSAESRQVPLPYAKALLPALIFGYLVPTILMFLPYSDTDHWTTQAMVALWQPCPWFVDALGWVLSIVYSSMDSQTPQKQASLLDIAYLDTIYTVAFVVSALSHIGTLLVCLLSGDPQHSFNHIFFSRSGIREPSLTEGLRAIFQADFWIIFASSLVWAFLAIWDLKRIAKTEVSLSAAVAALLLGSVCVGPAAAVAAVWYWREHVMAREGSA